jgi:hypothetical protein
VSSSDTANFGGRFALKLFGEERGARNRSGAAAAQKARFVDSAVVETDSELQNVAANGIAHLDTSIGVSEFTGIARVAKMVENSLAEHREKYRKAGDRLQRELKPKPSDSEVAWEDAQENNRHRILTP